MTFAHGSDDEYVDQIKFRPKHQIKANLKRHLVVQEKINAQSIDAIINTWGSHKA